ncbi:histone-lysine N-methyltransferase ATXR2 [Actinidia rufa]|uniref:Histone-lysine N-methyltransferase ATXR2 n=1 Tax=Actinidia rufa TaxID=165716 RepID=A0A7J0FGM5_9ERIC|nr:histone-lysine N-methyltransferase ATXR2 [Actinidia rufa]
MLAVACLTLQDKLYTCFLIYITWDIVISNLVDAFLWDSDLVVASPVEDYFLYIDDLPYSEKKEAERITRPVLDALGEDYSVCCQGQGWPSNNNCSATHQQGRRVIMVVP